MSPAVFSFQKNLSVWGFGRRQGYRRLNLCDSVVVSSNMISFGEAVLLGAVGLGGLECTPFFAVFPRFEE